MNGADYIALTRISNRKNETLAATGETCERVPAESLGWLFGDGLIQYTPRVEVSPPPARGRRTRGE